ncbi:MAG: hypothetical protein KBT13_08390 [Bacteroidales bacterium]|uniref:hypothetical protein n=1 Tax=Sodaliphilus sp. TaxID=2815818 RepID=UPI001B5312D5|nr:hypothetical protein [Candidatus Sodaliphilus limicaballi]
MKQTIATLLVMLLAVASGCQRINNKEVPNYVVNIDLGSHALWATYGVSGVGEHRIFDRAQHLPANFAYNANTYTGYGGVLLIMGLDASTGSYAPIAFDASCPVERQASVKVSIDASTLEAVCPQCKSRYNVLTGSGGPVSGRAYTSKYGLRMCSVHPSKLGGYIITSK